jgi:hypothetical protein
VTNGNGLDGPRPASQAVGIRPTDGAVLEPAEARAIASFAHASEAEMARILDFYAVRWEYEPHTFPILWNLEGAVVESFAPDFYLPDLGIYLEMTTLRQQLVRKKNRKLRRLRELYPDLRVKLFYARDFRALMLKYGKFALVAELSGTPGQVVSAREQRQAAAAAALAAPVVADLVAPVIAAALEPSVVAAAVESVAFPAPAVPVALPVSVVVPARSLEPAATRRSRSARRRRAAAARRAAPVRSSGPEVAENADVQAAGDGA